MLPILMKSCAFTTMPSASNPTIPLPSTTGAMCARNKGDREGALQDYNEAIRLKPDYAERLLQPGLMCAAPKATWRARCRITTRPSALSPTMPIAFNNRGIARRAKGDLEGALQDYNEAIRLKPDYANRPS